MGTTINIDISCVRRAQEICGTVAVQRSSRAQIERSEIGYVVDLDAGVIALAPRICFRQSDAALSAETVREALRERCIDADAFAVILTTPETIH